MTDLHNQAPSDDALPSALDRHGESLRARAIAPIPAEVIAAVRSAAPHTPPAQRWRIHFARRLALAASLALGAGAAWVLVSLWKPATPAVVRASHVAPAPMLGSLARLATGPGRASIELPLSPDWGPSGSRPARGANAATRAGLRFMP